MSPNCAASRMNFHLVAISVILAGVSRTIYVLKSVIFVQNALH